MIAVTRCRYVEEAEGTYRILVDEQAQPWRILRNDNEIEAGNRDLAFVLVHDDRIESAYEGRTRQGVLLHFALHVLGKESTHVVS